MIICHLQVTTPLMKVSTSADDCCFEDEIISSDMCVCGALGRAHSRDCPMSSRSSLPTKVYSTDSRLQSDSVWGAVAKPKLRQEEEPAGI